MTTDSEDIHRAMRHDIRQAAERREIDRVYSYAYGYIIGALDSYARGRLSAAELIDDYHQLQGEVARAVEVVLSTPTEAPEAPASASTGITLALGDLGRVEGERTARHRLRQPLDD